MLEQHKLLIIRVLARTDAIFVPYRTWSDGLAAVIARPAPPTRAMVSRCPVAGLKWSVSGRGNPSGARCRWCHAPDSPAR